MLWASSRRGVTARGRGAPLGERVGPGPPGAAPRRALFARASRRRRRHGLFAIDLVPDLPRWSEYRRRVSLTGLRGRTRVTLVESVRQDRKRRLTIFDHE